MSTVEKLKELRLTGMRLGQSAGYTEPLLSQPEISVTMIPLTEAEYIQCIEVVTGMDVPDNIIGAVARDRRNQNEVLFRSIRNPDDLSKRLFESMKEMTELLEIADINHLFDLCMEMSESVNPSPGSFTDDELDEIKKVLAEMDLNELSGRQWYALKRFLSLTGNELLPVNSLGSISTNLSTTMNDDEKSIPTV
jgi:hypothetical protein